MWFGIGALLVNIFLCLKIKDNTTLEIAKSLTDYAQKLGLSFFHEREFKRTFERIGDKISKTCMDLFDRYNIDKERQEVLEAIIFDALKTISIDSELMLTIKRDTNTLERIISDKCSKNPDYNTLDPNESELVQSLICQVSRSIIRIFNEIPEMSKERAKYLMESIDDLNKKVDKILNELNSLEDLLLTHVHGDYQMFEKTYRNRIIDRYDFVQLFGIDNISEEMKRYKLSTAYVNLQVEDINLNGDKEKRSIDIDKLLTKQRKNIWISGEAGSGKTTCLSWIATQVASCKLDVILSDIIPVVVELRSINLNQLSIVECINKARDSINSSVNIPDGWLEEKTTNAKLLFLIDGFDEIEEKDRNKVFNWIQILDKDNRCYKIFTSRPQVLNRPDIDDLVEVRMLPMKMSQIEKFVEYWHNTVLKNSLSCPQEVVDEYKGNLITLIRNDHALRKLAKNPLLCAIISALHYKSKKIIPTGRRDLYEACCRMLLDGRESERGITTETVSLPYEKKKRIISKVAYNMMKNSLTESPYSMVKEFVESTLEDMALNSILSEDLLKYYINRTGIIFEPSTNKLAFVHRSFQEYLCATEMARQGDWNFALEKIANDNWMETICLLIGMGKREQADLIINTTLTRGKRHIDHNKYLFYAFEYLSGTVEVSPTLRDKIITKIKKLIPPKGEGHIIALKNAGELAVKHLAYKEKYSYEDKLNCIRVLFEIKTMNALKCVLNYLYSDCEEKQELWLDTVGMLSEMIDEFQIAELKGEEIPRLLNKCIQQQKDNTLLLTQEIIYCLKLESKIEMNDLAQYFPDKIMIDLDEVLPSRGRLLPDILAERIKQLKISGDYYNFHMISFNNMSNLSKLHIDVNSDEFNIYKLAYYNVFRNLEELVLFVRMSHFYFVGDDISFLKKCKKLGLIIFTDDYELNFEHIEENDSLEELLIATQSIDDYDYGDLSACKSLKKLILIGNGSHTVKSRFEFEFEIKCYDWDDPFIEFEAVDADIFSL